MNIKLAGAIILSFLSTAVYAERLQVGPVFSEQPEQISFVVTLPPGTELIPKASDFQLLDGTKAIKNADLIEPFGKSNKLLILLLCVDASGSMSKAILKETQDALIGLLTQTRPQDKLGLVSFANKLSIDSGFISDRNALIKSIRKLTIRGKKTVLFQALVDALNLLHKDDLAGYRRLLLITDGKDEGSIESLDSVINLSKNYGIPIDVVGRGKVEQQLTKGLDALANATGGRFVFARPDTISLKDGINRIYKNVIEDTWIVHFRYKPDPQKPDLQSGFIKFESNNTLTLSAIISKGIPAPMEIIAVQKEVSEPPAHKIDWKALLPYLGLTLAVVSVVFICWLFWHYRRAGKPVKSSVPDQRYSVSDSQTIAEPELHVRNESKLRQTLVGTIPTALKPGKNLDLSNLVLAVIKGPLEGQRIPVNKPLFRIGADPDNDLVLTGDEYISGSHALLRYDNGELLLSDQHSRNGTLLNGEWVKDKAITVLPGDVIDLGNSSLKIMEI